MKKDFKNLDDQVDLLISRNLKINNRELAKMYLLLNNYYYVVNGFGKFLQLETDKYDDTSKFEHLIVLHELDKNLRDITSKYIFEVEHRLKSVLAYEVANEYKNLENHYENILNEIQHSRIDGLKINIKKMIEDKNNKNYSNPIKHYSRKGFIPIWVLINELYLGDTITLFDCLDDRLKTQITSHFSLYLKTYYTQHNIRLNKNILFSFLKSTREFRNVVAHNNKLMGFRSINNLKYIHNLHNKYSFENTDERQNWFCYMSTLQIFLHPNESEIVIDSILKTINVVKNEYPDINWVKVLKSLGFPDTYI